ncbi:nSTAND1 domain-containing NTPase [Nocardia beijingensis]
MIIAEAGQATISPRSATARAEFERQFVALYKAAGSPPLRTLAASARQRAHSVKNSQHVGPVSAQRISDWKSGRNVPARFEVLLPVLLVLIDHIRRRKERIQPDLVSLKAWKALWEHAQPAKTRRSSAAAGSPFRGAAHYTHADRADFTGRDRAVQDVIALVDAATNATGSERLVALIGATGAGKTSLLEAGLAPALRSSGTWRWSVLTTQFGDDPVGSLEAVTARSVQLHREAAEHPAGDRSARQLVIIDGFEIFTSPRLARETQLAVLRLLLSLTEVAVVMLSLRADGAAGCREFPVLADTLACRGYQLGALDLDELRTVITEPARRHGIKIEPGVEELLLTAIVGSITARRRRGPGEGSALSILSVTMHAIWSEREPTRLTVASYRRVGGVEGVLHRAADTVWEELSVTERPHAKRIILALISVRRDADETRRRVPHAELHDIIGESSVRAAVLDKLVQSRLVTIAADHACLSHDLILTWPRLTEWLDAELPAVAIAG